MTTIVNVVSLLGTIAIAYGIGTVRGHRKGIKSVMEEIEWSGTFHAFDHVIVGYKTSLANWVKGTGIPKAIDPFQDQDKVAEAKVATEPLNKIEPAQAYRADPGNVQHAKTVILKGTYEHPFLNTGNQG